MQSREVVVGLKELASSLIRSLMHCVRVIVSNYLYLGSEADSQGI